MPESSHQPGTDEHSLLLEEATAIYEVFLRADMLPPEARRKVRQDLRRYTEVRLDADM